MHGNEKGAVALRDPLKKLVAAEHNGDGFFRTYGRGKDEMVLSFEGHEKVAEDLKNHCQQGPLAERTYYALRAALHFFNWAPLESLVESSLDK